MKKLSFVIILLTTGFFLIQVAKATGLDQDIHTGYSFAKDSIPSNDSSSQTVAAVADPKLEFKNLFKTALTGDASNGAKLNPLAITFVEKYISKNRKGFLAMKEWGRSYFNMMDEVLDQHGLPRELKYISVIESGLKLNAGSKSGAIGPWALMPATAHTYGLRTGKGRDERLDYVKSTHAAASLLTDLYAKYGDWLLVIAAYNSGPGNVDKAIKRCGGSRDFWTLQYYLPNETMNHVKKFIGAHYIFEGEGGITTVTKDEMQELVNNASARLKEEELNNSTAFNISGRFNASVIIRYIDMDMAEFNRYNPNFENEIALNGKYFLRLPTQKMNIFVAKRYQILDESLQLLLNSSGGNTRN